MNKNIFDQDFIKHSQNVLKNACFGQKTLFKKDFAKLLGFNIDDPKNSMMGLNIISIMFDLGYFIEYKIVTGKYGGIIHVPSFQKSLAESFPKGFLQNLYDILCLNCSQNPISRNEIAKKLNYDLPEDQVCNLITSALQKKYIIGFKGKPGKNGGIVKMLDVQPKLTVENAHSSLDLPEDESIVATPSSSFWEALSQAEQSTEERALENHSQAI